MSELSMRRCRRCRKITEHVGPGTTHIVHLFLSLVSSGLWIPIWVIVYLSNDAQSACRECGKKRGMFG